MQVNTIAIDIAKNVFRFMASMQMIRLFSTSRCGGHKYCPSSTNSLRASSAWKPVHRPITGHAN